MNTQRKASFPADIRQVATRSISTNADLHTDYKRFDCSFSIDLPAVTGAYSYDVKVFPGDVSERAANTINVGERIGKHT